VVRRETFVKGRGNVLIEYPCANKNAPYVSFVGCHLDVVPANPDDWDFNPYELSVNGDELRGRGVTDCLGIVCVRRALSCTNLPMPAHKTLHPKP
jgi:acetylornithine deacetylase